MPKESCFQFSLRPVGAARPRLNAREPGSGHSSVSGGIDFIVNFFVYVVLSSLLASLLLLLLSVCLLNNSYNDNNDDNNNMSQVNGLIAEDYNAGKRPPEPPARPVSSIVYCITL